MLNLMGHEFADDQAAIVCTHVTDGQPVVEVAHDLDRVVQVLCARFDHGAQDALVVHLHHLMPVLEALGLPTIDPGHLAQLSEGGWIVEAMPPEEEDA
ncbi:Uncharacterised protein [Brevundimonas vesicularis]|uniref:Uncharacterized protein n=1 Tax=Brevundimonas vesicularis TaxID=41276 RepID=A0A2X1CDA4_BREVE|nr:hypothetical protein [Brevundimonas vesicularis]SPU52281.1 Uncharacterised protein [Brevundimonas vesicularis]